MICAIDVGLKRIGLAFLLNNIPIPQNPILRKNRNQAASEISQILEQNKATKLIVGIPKGGSSFEQMQRRIKHFVSLINFSGEIYYVDEYGSSQEAKQLMSSKDKRDGKLDSLSASIILQRWLDSL